jgi:hypothetical protein
MPEALGTLVVVVAVAACVWLSISSRSQVRQLRAELEDTQRELNALKAVVETPAPAPPPPPLPRSRSSSGLDDLREQLRAAHREEDSSPEPS